MSQPSATGGKARTLVAALAISIAGFATWVGSEGFSSPAYIPTKGDVPTIGHGSTRYENGQPVRMTDKPITRQRAEQLARNLMTQEEKQFKDSLPGVKLYQDEYDLYFDFVGNFGLGNWKTSSMRTRLLLGQYRQACDALLKWRMQAGRDCSLPQNWGPQGCKGVWTRQQERHAKCIAAQ